jgi:hypothetical protein
MRAIKRLILGVFLLALVMIAVAFALPRNVSVERSAVINAPESDVFPYVNNLRKFNEWSPWSAKDPEMQVGYAGPAQGKGARMTWDSREFGTGTQEIVASEPNRSVEVALDFGDQGNGIATWTLFPSGAGTKVSWGFRTDMGNNPVSRWMGLMFDRWIGKDYEEGLARLKQAVETQTSGR